MLVCVSSFLSRVTDKGYWDTLDKKYTHGTWETHPMVRKFRICDTNHPEFHKYKDLDYKKVIRYLKNHPRGILNLKLNKSDDIIGKGMDISKLELMHYICIGRVVDDNNKLVGYDMISSMCNITFMTVEQAKECILHDFIYNMSFVRKIRDKYNHTEVNNTAIRVHNRDNIAYTRKYKDNSRVYENYNHKTVRYFI